MRESTQRRCKRSMDDIGDVFGEFVINLRSALDNAGYSIAVAAGKPNAKHCAFPFAGSLDDLVKAVGRCTDLPKRNPIAVSRVPTEPAFEGTE
jgi:hypothetical protein